MIRLICIRCDRDFLVKPYRKDRARFCSRKCVNMYPRTRTSDRDRYVIDGETNCWNYTMNTSFGGYGLMAYRLNGRCFNVPAHRYFYEKYRGKISSGLQLDHLCRNRKCVNPEHLEEVTGTENIRRGLATKLNEEKVKEIRKLYRDGLPQGKIASMFTVGQQNISAIIRRISWKDIN